MVLKDLEAAFNSPQGKMLDRQLASFVQDNFLAGKVVAGTREFGYLCGTPGRFLEKAANYIALIAVRLKHANEGRTAHKPPFWTKLGGVVSDASLLVFTMGLQDILQKTCNGHVKRAQQVHILPEEKMKSHFQLLHSMKQVKGRLLELQGMLHMLQLLSGYLPPSHFTRFCRVWLGHKLHCLCPTIAKYLPEVLLQGTYKGCNVLLDAPVVDSKLEHVHNACQCAWRKPFGRNRVPVKFGSWSGQGAPWCADGGPLMRQDVFTAQRSPHQYGLFVDRNRMLSPAHIACKVSQRGAHAFTQAQHALTELCALLDHLHDGFIEYAGDRGVERHLQTVWKCNGRAFDFHEWVSSSHFDFRKQQQARDHREDAFEALWIYLWSDLSKTFFPPEESIHGDVAHHWPRQAPLHQFRTLQERIIGEYQRQVLLSCGPFLKPAGYLCLPVLRMPPLSRKLWQLCAKFGSEVLLLMCAFGFAEPLVLNKHPLRAVDCGQQFDGKFAMFVEGKPVIQANALATYPMPYSRRGRLVLIVKALFEIDSLKVAEAIEGDPAISKGCWLACRLFMRSHRTGCTSCCAESWGSVVNSYWNPKTTGLSMGALTARATLRISGFIGDGSDDKFVECVTSRLKCQPFLSERSLRAARNKGHSHQEIAAAKLMAQINAELKHSNATLLTSAVGNDLLESLKVTSEEDKRVLSEWRKHTKQRSQGYDVVDPEEADVACFRKFCTFAQKSQSKIKIWSFFAIDADVSISTEEVLIVGMVFEEGSQETVLGKQSAE